MIVITGRSRFGAFIKDLFDGAPDGVPPLTPIILPPEDRVVFPSTTPGLLALDLGSGACDTCCTLADRWRQQFPSGDVIAVLPWVNPQSETRTALALARCGKLQSAIAPDDTNPTTWVALVRDSGINRIAAELRVRLLGALRVPPSGLVESNRVLSVLEAAPRVTNVDTYCRYTGVERRRQERQLRLTHQRQTKELLVAFRWLWAVALREHSWRPGDIARAMGYSDSSEAAKCLFRTIPWGMREFTRCGSERILNVFATHLIRTTLDPTPLPPLDTVASVIVGGDT